MPFVLREPQTEASQEEGYLSQAGRGIARTASRIGEQVAGTPGDIFSLINEYIARPVVGFATGEETLPYEQTPLGKAFPTTSEHKKRLESHFGETIKPQNKIESFVDNIVADATGLAIPGSKAASAGSLMGHAARKLAISTAANAAGKGVEDWTANETKGNLTKLGSLLMLSMFDKPAAAKVVGEMYKPLQKTVESLKPVNATGAQANLTHLKNKMTKGTIAPSEKFIIDEVDAVLSKIKDGKITPEEAWAVKRSLNEKMSKVLFDIPKKADQARARKLGQAITHEMDDLLKQTAKQDPTFYKELKSVDKAFGTIARSNFITNALEKNIRLTPMTEGLIHIFGGGLGSAIGQAAIPYNVYKIMFQISQSPLLAKHYGKVVSYALADNAPLMNRELKKLDQGLQKEEKKPKRFVLVE